MEEYDFHKNKKKRKGGSLVGCPPSKKLNSKQPTMLEAFSEPKRVSQRAIDQHLMSLIVNQMLPLSLVEQEDFIDFVHCKQ